MKAPHALAAFAASIALLGSACGYTLVGQGSVLPPHIKSFVVTPFENRTQRPEIEQRVTERVQVELAKRGQYRVLNDRAKADAILEGAILQYRKVPVQFSSELLANRVEVVVRLEATLRDLTTDQVLWSQSGLVFKEQYDVPQGELFFDQERIAIDEIAEGAAKVLVTSILEGF